MCELKNALDSSRRNGVTTDFNGYMTTEPVLNQLVERIEGRHAHSGEANGESTRPDSLDEIISGYQAGDLVLFAGRPSHDKAVLVRKIIERASLLQKVPTAVFTQGIPVDRLLSEMLSSVSGIPYQRLERADLTDNEWPQLTAALEKISGTRLLLNDVTGLKIEEIRSICHRIRRNHGLGLVVVMSVQRMECTQTREDATTRKARKLKSLALEFDVPVLALSDLSAADNFKGDGWPYPTLRDIGDYEQQADVVIFTYRAVDVENDADSTMTTEVVVAKQPCGLTTKALLSLQPELARPSSERRQKSAMD